jgi:hypothetical protein
VKLNAHLNLVPRLRMSGVITPLPQYAFKAWCLVKKGTGTTLPLALPVINLHFILNRFMNKQFTVA